MKFICIKRRTGMWIAIAVAVAAASSVSHHARAAGHQVCSGAVSIILA